MTQRNRARRTASTTQTVEAPAVGTEAKTVPAPVEELTLEGAKKTSERAFRKASRETKGAPRDRAYGKQAQEFLDSVTALGISFDDERVKVYCGRAKKNIAQAAKWDVKPAEVTVATEKAA